MEDFEAPIDGAAEGAVNPFGETEPPQEESYAPQEVPYEPPVQPARNFYDEAHDLIEEARNEFRQELDEEKLRSRVENSEARAMKTHDGSDGLPPYSELVGRYAMPLMQQRPALRQLVLGQSNPAEAAFVVGFCTKYPDLIPQVIARKGRLDAAILQPLNFRPTARGKDTERRQPRVKVSYEEMDNETFISQVLDPFKMSEEGS